MQAIACCHAHSPQPGNARVGRLGDLALYVELEYRLGGTRPRLAQTQLIAAPGARRVVTPDDFDVLVRLVCRPVLHEIVSKNCAQVLSP